MIVSHKTRKNALFRCFRCLISACWRPKPKSVVAENIDSKAVSVTPFHMPRSKRIPLIKGKKRLRLKPNNEMQIKQTIFCSACGRPTQAATIRRNAKIAKSKGLPVIEEVARVCVNVEGHKDGKRYFWPVKNTIIPIY